MGGLDKVFYRNIQGYIFWPKAPPPGGGNKIDPQIFGEENRPCFRVILLKQGRKRQKIYMSTGKSEIFLFYLQVY